jgi:hypothetical protein
VNAFRREVPIMISAAELSLLKPIAENSTSDVPGGAF